MARPVVTDEIARAAAADEANRSMRAAGRTAWSREDYNRAVATFNRLNPPPPDVAAGFTVRHAPETPEQTALRERREQEIAANERQRANTPEGRRERRRELGIPTSAWRKAPGRGVWRQEGGNGVMATVVEVTLGSYAWNVSRHGRALASGYTGTLSLAQDNAEDRLIDLEREFTDAGDVRYVGTESQVPGRSGSRPVRVRGSYRARGHRRRRPSR